MGSWWKASCGESIIPASENGESSMNAAGGMTDDDVVRRNTRSDPGMRPREVSGVPISSGCSSVMLGYVVRAAVASRWLTFQSRHHAERCPSSVVSLQCSTQRWVRAGEHRSELRWVARSEPSLRCPLREGRHLPEGVGVFQMGYQCAARVYHTVGAALPAIGVGWRRSLRERAGRVATTHRQVEQRRVMRHAHIRHAFLQRPMPVSQRIRRGVRHPRSQLREHLCRHTRRSCEGGDMDIWTMSRCARVRETRRVSHGGVEWELRKSRALSLSEPGSVPMWWYRS
jgi:hypothetical protein